ncbi:hypothetical protein BJ973_007304 [Actinoplanes tereljensis]|uniref:DUF732 domain-containing protein n=1 Tax=Paractinoplanes tereljensis TaxID=571912 RepID=A0A919NX86_9ACTN|nr:DUF732 domain-containing protein [Actinoplanes tereljensis]GIF25047.1 hypothetical protein Ate02nite_77770 [Actinoplanes tereljensis]
MRARKFVIVGAALVALAGCSSTSTSSSGNGAVPIAATPQAPDPIEASVAASKRAEAAGDVDSYVAAIKAIDPKLVKDQVSAVDMGKGICQEAAQGKTDAQVATDVALNFSVDQAAALKVVTATKTALCPGKR